MATYPFIFYLLFIYYLYDTRIDVIHSFLFYNTQKQINAIIYNDYVLLRLERYKNFSNSCW